MSKRINAASVMPKIIDQMRQSWNLDDAARRAKVSPRTARRWLKRGESWEAGDPTDYWDFRQAWLQMSRIDGRRNKLSHQRAIAACWANCWNVDTARRVTARRGWRKKTPIAMNAAIETLAEGGTRKAAAKAAGVTEATFRNWYRADRDFGMRVDKARSSGRRKKQERRKAKRVVGRFLDGQAGGMPDGYAGRRGRPNSFSLERIRAANEALGAKTIGKRSFPTAKAMLNAAAQAAGVSERTIYHWLNGKTVWRPIPDRPGWVQKARRTTICSPPHLNGKALEKWRKEADFELELLRQMYNDERYLQWCRNYLHRMPKRRRGESAAAKGG